MIKKIFFLICLILILTACQPTPQQDLIGVDPTIEETCHSYSSDTCTNNPNCEMCASCKICQDYGCHSKAFCDNMVSDLNE